MNGIFKTLPLLCLLLVFAGCSGKEEAQQEEVLLPPVSEILASAVLSLGDGEVERAAIGFQMIIDKAYSGAPERPMAHAYLGQLAMRTGNFDIAAENFMASIKEAPNVISTRMALGNALFSSGKLDEAIEVWQVVSEARPNLGQVHNNLAVAYLDLKKPKMAIQHLEQAISLTPDHLRAHNNLVNAYRAAGMEDAAQSAERRIADIQARLKAQADAPAAQ